SKEAMTMWYPTVGKWADPSVPKDGWARDRLYQLDGGTLPCEMCGELYRTLGTHGILKHPTHPELRVCMMCEDFMMEHLEAWMAREWSPSKKGNPQIRIGDYSRPDFFVTVFPKDDGWSAVISRPPYGDDDEWESEFMETTHATEEGAKR